MIFGLVGFFFYMLLNKKLCLKVNQYNTGFDERQMNDTIVTDMMRVRMNNEKWKLLYDLNSPKKTYLEKVKLIEMSRMLDDLNPRLIKAPNLLKGIKNDFLEKDLDNEEM